MKSRTSIPSGGVIGRNRRRQTPKWQHSSVKLPQGNYFMPKDARALFCFKLSRVDFEGHINIWAPNGNLAKKSKIHKMY